MRHIDGVVLSARAVLLALFSILFGLGGCRGEAGNQTEVTASSRQALAPLNHRFVITLPSTTLDATALGVSSSLRIADRAKVETAAGGFAAVASVGATLTDLGVDSRVGSTTSVAPITLRDRARVTGNATSGGLITLGNGATVTGTRTPNAAVPLERLSWMVSFPQSGSGLTLPPDQSAPLAPGSHGPVHIFSRSTVTLSSGTYYLDELILEPESRMVLDTTAGPVFIYVRNNFIYRGVTIFNGPSDRLLVGFAGSMAPAIEGPFDGTLVAPNATVRLGVGGTAHRGAVYAKSIELDPDARLIHRFFSGWDLVPFDVVPTLNCVEQRTNGSFAAVLGYFNRNKQPVSTPVGPENSFTPGAASHGQPTTFLVGRFPAEFSIDFGSAQTLTWRLNGNSLVVPRTAPRCAATLAVGAVKDTTVKDSSPRANFGNAATLDVSSGRHTLIEVDRDALRRDLGTARYVSNAVLELTRASGSQPVVDAFVVTRSWTELGATWNCANDIDTSASGEACSAGSAWKVARDDVGRRNPWKHRSQARRVVGTWSNGKLRFDVTRDLWDLLGSEGVRRTAAWALVLDAGSTASATFHSRQSVTPPKLTVTLTTRPEVDPAGSAPLSIAVDTSIAPGRPDVPPFLDGQARPVSTLRGPNGTKSDFVDEELVFRVASTAELATVLARWNGVIVDQIPPPTNLPDMKTLVVVRIDSSRAQSAALLPRSLQLDNRPRGAHAFSSSRGLATMAAAAEEVLAGRHASMNWVLDPAQPSTHDWVTRNIADSSYGGGFPNFVPPHPHPPLDVSPPIDLNGGFFPSAFNWPGFANYDPDPTSPEVLPPNLRTFVDGTPIQQTFAVAEAWRALALSGRLNAASVRVGIVDASFRFGPINVPFFDYPAFIANGNLNTPSPSVGHGNQMVQIGFGVVGNSLGAAGPGGPVAFLDLQGMAETYNATLAGMSASYQQFQARVLNVSRSGSIIAIATPFENAIEDGVRQMRDNGMLIFTSAGNGLGNFGTTPIDLDKEDCFVVCWEEEEHYPCEHDGALCVSGIDFDGTFKAVGSNYGDEVAIGGPWFSYLPTAAPVFTNFNLIEGMTSGATAWMSGATSLILAADPAKSVDDAEFCLFSTSGIADDGFDTRHPNILNAVRCMMTGNPSGDLPPHLLIESPTDGFTVAAGGFLNIRAIATDYELGELTITWTSDVNGPPVQTGSGQTGLFIFTTEGDRLLTATASDGVNPPVSQTVLVHVSGSVCSFPLEECAGECCSIDLACENDVCVVPPLPTPEECSARGPFIGPPCGVGIECPSGRACSGGCCVPGPH